MHKIVLAITGASGSIYARLLIEKLLTIKQQWQDVGVVMTDNAKQVWETELGNNDYTQYPVNFYSTKDFTAPFASGSGRYNTMIIAPCSMGTRTPTFDIARPARRSGSGAGCARHGGQT